MKTSSYDEPEEEVNVDESYYSYEAPTTESCEPAHEDNVEQGFEASFAKCKVSPIPSSEAPIDSFESSFPKCSVTSATERHEDLTVVYEESVTDSYDSTPVGSNEAALAKRYEARKAEGNEALVSKSYEAMPAGSNAALVTKINEALTASITVQFDNYTPNMPPPVPKRTLLPSKTVKETSVVPETAHSEIPVVTEEVDPQNVACRDVELVSPEEVTQKTEAGAERWSDSTSVSLPGQVEDVETVSSDPGNAQCEPVSEMYYTASSEVSLLSDTEFAEKVQNEEEEGKDDRKNVIAGHVAAMRERFESMTRASTPCPDLIRSLSPSLEVFRNMSPSPDRLA